MPYTKVHLDMAMRHVADGERHIARQKEIITRLAGWGRSTDLADRLLAVFEMTLAEHRRHLGEIQAHLRRAELAST